MTRRLIAAALCCAVSTATLAPPFVLEVAAQADEFSATVEKASAEYEAGNYEAAAELFKKAYDIKQVSNILYNIARIYEDAGDIDAAIEFYDKFVIAPNVEQGPRKDAVERLKTLREIKELRDKKEKPVEPEKPVEEPEKPIEPAPEPEPKSNTLRTVGWAVLGVGGASLIGAGVLGLMAGSQHAKFEDATTLEDRRAAASAGENQAMIADVLLITGAVAAVTGGVLVIATSVGGDDKPTATLGVTPMIGTAWGAGVGVKF